MEYFVNKVYKMLNPVIINWVDYNTSLRLIEEYEAKRYKCLKGFNTPIDNYNVEIVLKNGYTISIRTDITKMLSDNTVHNSIEILTVSILSPAVDKIRHDGWVESYPTKIIKYQKVFKNGEFDIDNIDWVADIQKLLNEYVVKEKAELMVIE